MAPFTHPDRLPSSSKPRGDGENKRGRGGARGRGGGRGRGGAAVAAPGGIPAGSVSKLKAQIRQTTRLLAKDDLNADVRLTSERRLASLQEELTRTAAANQTAELEKKMATRYRGVRFFERQKVLRKIKQAKKALAASFPDSPDFGALSQSLLEARIDLYYVLTYPKTDKYIALFPDGAYVPHSPPVSPATPASMSREKLRETIKGKMASGALGVEPEEGELGIEGEEDVKGSGVGEKRASGEEDEGDAGEEQGRPAKKSRGEAVAPSASAPVAKIAPAAAAAPTEGDAPADEPKRKLGKKDRKARRQAEAEAEAAKEKETATGWAADGDDFFA